MLFACLTILTTFAIQGSLQTDFYCKNGSRINANKFCNGLEDCDGSDEINNISAVGKSSRLYISCTVSPLNKTCLLHRDYLCNATVTCQGLTPCDVGCPTHYKCQKSKKCVLRSTVCDGNACNGCPEDDDWQNGVGFKCVRNGKICRLPQQLLWDNVQDCDDGADLCYKTNLAEDGRDIRKPNATFDSGKCFKCLDNSMIIRKSKVCNSVIECSDLSDECLCEVLPVGICSFVQLRTQNNNKLKRLPCKTGEVVCNPKLNVSVCLNRSSICDGKRDCRNRRDESSIDSKDNETAKSALTCVVVFTIALLNFFIRFSFCKGTLPCTFGRQQEKGRRCRCSKRCVAATGVICDGIGDCPVPSRQPSNWDFPPGYPEDECRASCLASSGFKCTNSSYSVRKSKTSSVTCKAYTPRLYPNGTKIIRTFKISAKKVCDGILTCDVNLADERLCRNRFLCPNNNGKSISIPKSKKCDGYLDCDDGSDERKKSCPRRFYCPSMNGRKVSIKQSRICDFTINCDNAQDELNCTLEDGRFYCENKRPLFVRRKKMFDGVGDCEDWSDECPSSPKPESENQLSSRYELIGNPILRAVVWIMGILALVGNSVVIYGEINTIKMFVKQRRTASLVTNHMLVLNLAVADFLMAIYLLMLGIAGAVYSGSYCSQSLSWLTSRPCVAMGVLVVLSSETSTLTMILLTASRLYAIFRPIQSMNKPTATQMFLLISLAWLLSLAAALVPLSHVFQQTFVEKALLRDNVFFGGIIVHFTSAKSFVTKLLTYSPKFANTTKTDINFLEGFSNWHEIEGFLATHAPNSNFLNIANYFGYYSANSVCVPNLFVTRSDRAWKYSLGISIFNFLAFVFVATAYVIIMIRAQKATKIRKSKSKGSNKNTEIQRKIIRLIITDFCCWIPLSIMVFINFSGVKIDSISYAVAAIVLLPINSALNPILYSNFVDKLLEKLNSNKAKRQPSFSRGFNTRSVQISEM